MIAGLHLLDAARKAHAAIFRQHLALRHDGAGTHLVLQDRQPGAGRHAATPSAHDAQLQRQSDELKLVLEQLAQLLDDQFEIRRVMRHLVFVEGVLARGGLLALNTVPLDVLQRALHQFEGLVINWTPVGLATLRSKMAVAIIAQEKTPITTTQAPRDDYRSTFPLALDDAANLPTVQVHSDQATLSAVYAALGSAAPAGVDLPASAPT
jgi:hypothetical protein